MAITTTILKVFVASPSDVVEERKVLEEIINELNNLIGRKAGLTFELMKWETDTYPSVGEDPQSVINEQIGDDYDVFVGIIWKRFGTPTPRELSGTAEEFYGAFEKARANPKGVRVMFYFNNASAAMSDIDIDQLKMVKDFQGSIGQMGVYYWKYNELEEFEKLVRLHLGKVMQEFGTSWGEKSDLVVGFFNTPTPKLEDSIGVENNDDEEGFLDLIILTVEQFGIGGETFERINVLLQELNEKTLKRTEEFQQLATPINPNQAKQVANGFADDWENFVERMKVEIPIISKAFRLAIDSWTKSTELISDFNNDEEAEKQIQNALDTINDFIKIIADSKENTKGFRDVVAGMPRLTNKFNHAKKHVLEVLDGLLEEFSTEENLSIEAVKAMSSALPKN